MITINEFIADRKITMFAARTDSNPNMDGGENMDHWRCVLRFGKRRMTVLFSMGVGHNGKEPTAADVLDCLASDAAGIVNARSFEDWCRDYGYDSDSRKAERTFKVCEREAEKLRRFLGDADRETLMFTERS
jgi:hypothetical protein